MNNKNKSSNIIRLNCMDCKFKLGFLQGKISCMAYFQGLQQRLTQIDGECRVISEILA